MNPRLGVLLVGANAIVLASPLFALAALRIYDGYLVRQTERQLIAQSVVIGEAYRELWRAETSQQRGEAARGVGAPEPEIRPPPARDQTFVPIEPIIDLSYGVAAPTDEAAFPLAEPRDTIERRAGARLAPLLRRAQVFNLSGVRVLDRQGCVVATSRGDADRCLSHLPEVASALAGTYAALARERLSDEPTPPLGDVRSRGTTRIFSALPVLEDGRVIGVVRASRTSTDALTSLWQNRRGLILAGAATLFLVATTSVVFAGLIAWPLRRLTRAAEQVASGGGPASLEVTSFAPREVQTLAVALSRMTATLRERADYIAAFAANVSHELKTPLTGIRGAAELLLEQWRHMSDAQRERFVANIDADAQRMERLVTRLLVLARVEHGGEAEVELEVREVLGHLCARHAGADLRLSVAADVPSHYRVAPDHFTSAVGNLLDNAVRHGEGHPVEVRVGRAGERLRVEVRDRGPGISAANERRVFERFFTTERDRGGTGLGLTIVQAIAQRRGGSVSFTSGVEGTTFTLVL